MATIVIETTKEEQDQVIVALRGLDGQTVPLTRVAKEAKVPENRARYIITDLLEAGKIVRIPTKALSKHYIRYTYKVLEDKQ